MTDRHFTLEELSAYLDGELDLDQGQQAHLRGCPECTKVFEGQRSLRKYARDAAPAVPTDQMWAAIKTRLGEQEEKKESKHAATGHAKGARKAKAKGEGQGFRWGPGAWLGLSSALAAAGVILIIRPSVEESRSPMPKPASGQSSYSSADAPAPEFAPGDLAAAPQRRAEERHASASRAPEPSKKADRRQTKSARPAARRKAPAEDSAPSAAEPTGVRVASAGKPGTTGAGVGAPVTYMITAANTGGATVISPAKVPADITVASFSSGVVALQGTRGTGLEFGGLSTTPAQSQFLTADARLDGEMTAFGTLSSAPAVQPQGTSVVVVPGNTGNVASVAAASAPAPQQRGESAGRSSRARQPSAAPSAAEAAPVRETPRPMFITKKYILTADTIDKADPKSIKASGNVLIFPVTPGVAYAATVDGVARQVKDKLEGVSAVIADGERLTVQTKAGAQPVPAAPRPAESKK